MPARTLHRSGTSAPRHRGREAPGNSLSRPRDGRKCVFLGQRVFQRSCGPQKSTLSRSCEHAFGEIGPKSASQDIWARVVVAHQPTNDHSEAITLLFHLLSGVASVPLCLTAIDPAIAYRLGWPPPVSGPRPVGLQVLPEGLLRQSEFPGFECCLLGLRLCRTTACSVVMSRLRRISSS